MVVELMDGLFFPLLFFKRVTISNPITELIYFILLKMYHFMLDTLYFLFFVCKLHVLSLCFFA